jgi:hypothetical protein
MDKITVFIFFILNITVPSSESCEKKHTFILSLAEELDDDFYY